MPHSLRALLLVTVSLMVSTGALAGQDPAVPGLGPEGRVGAVVSLQATAMEVGDHVVPTVGLSLGIRVSGHLELAGEGAFGLRDVPVSSGEAQNRSELSLGYGGLSLRYGPGARGTSAGPVGHILLGAGTSRLVSPLVGAELNSDNFRILEAGVAHRFPLPGPSAVSVGAGYRFTTSTTELPSIGNGPMRGPFASLSIVLLRGP